MIEDLPAPHAPATQEFPTGLKAVRIAAGTTLIRVHASTNGPIWFGPAPGGKPGSRFDAPSGEWRTIYLAERLEGAFAESVLHRPAKRMMKQAAIEARSWSPLKLNHELILAKLYDDGCMYHGQDASISTILDYPFTRNVAHALWRDFPEIDGIAYKSGHSNGETCLAIFDRNVSATSFSLGTPEPFMRDTEPTTGLMARFGAIWDDSPPFPISK